MKSPSLVVVAGPLKGAVVGLGDEKLSIGRDPANRLCVGDLALSRRHCVIEPSNGEGGPYTLRDLQSLNGTFINGVPVNERALQHGDLIRVGDSVIIFLLYRDPTGPGLHPEEPYERTRPVELEDRALVGSTIKLARRESRYPGPDENWATPAAPSRAARDLNALLRISAALHATRGVESLQRKLLELILEVVPADCGAILLGGDSDDEFDSTVSCGSSSAVSSYPVAVSRPLVQQAMREKVAVLTTEGEDVESAREASRLSGGVRSALCAPLTIREHALGVVYLTSNDPAARFDEDHLQFLNAVAAIAAVALENARQLESLEGETAQLRKDLDVDHNMVGDSASMREVYEFVARVAPTDSTVLLRGESGTGKELVARAIHRNSRRAARPFVSINCAALTEPLLESELFGHEKGAFTGAIAQKLGKLETANGGTVFLDEVGELSLALQAKLLRVLQERELERVGGTRPVKVDVRWIAATNRELEEALGAGSFRQDLYYRLNVVTLTLPPLRKRREDIPLLANYFVKKYASQCKRKIGGLSAEARRCLLRYAWPGNVRELENAIERAVVLGSSATLLPEDLPEAVLESQPGATSSISRFHDAVREAKKELILKAVEQAAGNCAEAARLLGLQRTYLHRLIRILRLKERLKS